MLAESALPDNWLRRERRLEWRWHGRGVGAGDGNRTHVSRPSPPAGSIT